MRATELSELAVLAGLVSKSAGSFLTPLAAVTPPTPLFLHFYAFLIRGNSTEQAEDFFASLQMSAHSMARFFRFPSADSQQDFPMLLMGVLFDPGKFLRFADPLLKYSSNRSEEFMKHLVFGAACNGQVEIDIQIDEVAANAVQALLHVIHQAIELVEVALGCALGSESGGLGFDQ